MHRVINWWDDHQVLLYMAAILIGAAVGLAAPQLAPTLAYSIKPVLILLLFATFLAVPLIEVGKAFRDIRFLGTVLVGNFIIIPTVVFGLTRFVADDRGLLLGVLLVLLTPCIDYVIVFSGIAGGASARLLAATPLLMLVQILLLPAYLFLFAGADVLDVIDADPFIEAFLLLIVLPVAGATTVQAIARRHTAGQALEQVMAGAMVPLMMVTLAVVIGSQIAAVGSQVLNLTRVIPLYVAFVVIAIVIGKIAGRAARLDVAGTRAVLFTVTTRNSLVVLPLALALPPALSIAPLAVVTQTLVELLAMVVLVRIVPFIVPEQQSPHLTSAIS
ncbi:ACR3 family arsenite efflux pump ArsB [Pseudarthrobacter oxydans]|uniref:ACR3 family arsenite efflux pump ArsB n=1 Tax=Pseudarthrobacter oxydans TaxID=1671 RepID=A0AAW8NFL9_PSEOX|nr:bile acid:sodium symporter [Pseudarthrobacter oxydans]MDR7165699.1 ACR3 family arsenite efflux pump ArsB [Pseudarthrobacter oxydans]